MADASLGTATLRARLDASGLRVGLDQAKAETTRAIQAIDQRLAGLGRSFQRIGTGLTVGITAPLTALGVVGVRSAMQLETFAASLNVLVGDTERANAVFEELYEFSANTPFDWRSLTEGTRTLAAFQIEAERIVPTLSRIGDVAAGLQVPINDLAQIYGRVHVTGRLGMEEVNRLADRGVPIYTELAKQLGVTEVAVRDLVSAGKVGFPELESVFANLTNEGGMFFGMMDAQADTVQGRLNRLKDSFEQVTDVVGERLLPTFDKLVSAGQKATEWFVNLDESTQGLLVGLGVTLAATGPVLVGVGTLLVQIPKLVAGFQLLKTTLLPLVGPAGIVLGLAAGLYAVWTAMDVGRSAREESARQFDTLIGKLQQYRNEIVVTSEAERQAALESLERQRTALENIARVHRAQVESDEAFVRRYEERSFLGQVFSGDSLAADAAARSAQQGRQHVAELEQEIAAIDRQLERTRTMTIAPAVVVPPAVETGAGFDSFGIPEDNTTREVIIEVTVRNAQSAQELFDALAGEGTAVNRAVTRLGGGPEQVLEGMQRRAELFQTAMRRAWEIPDLTAAQFDYIVRRASELEESARAFEHAMSVSVMTGPGELPAPFPFSGGIVAAPSEPFGAGGPREAELLAQLDEADRQARIQGWRDQLAVNAELRAQAAAIRADTQQAIADSRPAPRPLAEPAVTSSLPESVPLVAPELQAVIPAARDLTANLEGVASALSDITVGVGSIAQVRDLIQALQGRQETTQSAEMRQSLALLIASLQVELERMMREAQPPVRSLDITPFAQIDGMDPAKWARAQADAAAEQRQAGLDFAETVIDAGRGFVGVIQAFQAGDVGGGIAGLGGMAAGIATLIPGGAAFAPLIEAGAGLLGALFGGGRRDVDESRRAAGAAVQSAPAIDLRVIINQSLNVQSLTDPASRRAVDGLLDDMVRRVEDTLKRNVLPRLDALEGAA